MLEKVKDIPPKILIINGSQKQWLRNHPDFGAFLEEKVEIENSQVKTFRKVLNLG